MPRKTRPSYILRKSALENLLAIGRHTQKHWGRAQRVKYIGALKDRCAWLAANPKVGKYHQELGYYSWHYGRHYIVYRIENDQLVIAFFMHDSMNFPENLSEVEGW